MKSVSLVLLGAAACLAVPQTPYYAGHIGQPMPSMSYGSMGLQHTSIPLETFNYVQPDLHFADSLKMSKPTSYMTPSLKLQHYSPSYLPMKMDGIQQFGMKYQAPLIKYDSSPLVKYEKPLFTMPQSPINYANVPLIKYEHAPMIKYDQAHLIKYESAPLKFDKPLTPLMPMPLLKQDKPLMSETKIQLPMQKLTTGLYGQSFTPMYNTHYAPSFSGLMQSPIIKHDKPLMTENKIQLPVQSMTSGLYGKYASGHTDYAQSNMMHIPIIKKAEDFSHDGSFSYLYQTANGISAQGQGMVKNQGTEDEAQVMYGSYTFTTPEGLPITTNWYADENGFHAEGAHLPKQPEMASMEKSAGGLLDKKM